MLHPMPHLHGADSRYCTSCTRMPVQEAWQRKLHPRPHPHEAKAANIHAHLNVDLSKARCCSVPMAKLRYCYSSTLGPNPRRSTIARASTFTSGVLHYSCALACDVFCSQTRRKYPK